MNVFKLLKYLLVDAFTFYGGGGKGGGSAPSAPDPNVVAAATTKTNTDTAAFNKALNLNNYSNPFGSQQTTQTGTDPNTGAPIYNTNVSANPQLTGALNGLLSQASQSGNINSNALNGLYGVNNLYAGSANNFGNLAQSQLGLNGSIAALQPQYQNISNGIGGLQNQFGAVNNNFGNLANQYQGISNNISNSAGSYSGLNSQLSGLGDQLSQGQAQQAGQQGQNAAYAAQKQYLDPQFSQQGESLSAQLANQGLTPGSEAYNNAMTNFNNQKQQAYSNAQNQAIMTGSQIGAQNLQNQISGINTQAGLLGQQGQNIGNTINAYGAQAGALGGAGNAYGQQGNALSNQAGLYGQQAGLVGNQAGLFGLMGNNYQSAGGLYGQQAGTYGSQAGLYGQMAGVGNMPYSQLGSIASMIPGYSGTGQSSAAPADIAGLYNNQYQSQLANYNAQQQSANNTQSGIMGLGSAAIMASMFSDRRLKRSIKRVATWANGLGVYTYRYKWEAKGVRHLGFMADEVRKIAPFAVLRDTNGFDRVNYQLAGSAR
jgi:hypothetical protein